MKSLHIETSIGTWYLLTLTETVHKDSIGTSKMG